MGISWINLLTVCAIWNVVQEIVSAGGKTVWGDPAEVGKVVAGASFDVVLDNNGKDVETVGSVTLDLLLFLMLSCGLFVILYMP